MKTLATGLLVLLSLLVAENSIAQQSINAPPDTIFYNGKIVTVDSGFTIQQAIGLPDGKVDAISGRHEVLAGLVLQRDATHLDERWCFRTVRRGSSAIPRIR